MMSVIESFYTMAEYFAYIAVNRGTPKVLTCDCMLSNCGALFCGDKR